MKLSDNSATISQESRSKGERSSNWWVELLDDSTGKVENVSEGSALSSSPSEFVGTRAALDSVDESVREHKSEEVELLDPEVFVEHPDDESEVSPCEAKSSHCTRRSGWPAKPLPRRRACLLLGNQLSPQRRSGLHSRRQLPDQFSFWAIDGRDI